MGQTTPLKETDIVSMNFWGFLTLSPFFRMAEPLFINFIKDNIANLKAEFYIPLAVDLLIKGGHARVKGSAKP